MSIPSSTISKTNRHPADGKKPITIFGPDFPFAFDDWIEHPAGLGSIPAANHVAVAGDDQRGIFVGDGQHGFEAAAGAFAHGGRGASAG